VASDTRDGRTHHEDGVEGARPGAGSGATGAAVGAARTGPATGRLRAWLRSPDGRAVAVLLVLPVLFFVVPSALGHPALSGDNLIQNLPLRVLTGRQLREGHLPVWNPYIWSGSPLLGGLNSGSFYPFTFFFVFLAPVAAFTVNLLGVYWAGGLGMYALTRQYGLRPLSSFLGAATYAFSGTMSGQLVHLGVIQGLGWMPLLVLAVLRLSWAVLGTGPVTLGAARRAYGSGVQSPDGPSATAAGRAGSPWPWVALLALMVGLEALTGEPRAMAETEVVGAAVAFWLVVRSYAGARVSATERVRLFGYVVLASVWGVLLAAAELAPGWTFIRASQRAVETYQFFGSGSLRVQWSMLMLVPDLFGGGGHFGTPHYFNTYNLPEVTGYVGLLPLGAALALLVRSFGRSRAPRASDWGMWLALCGFGFLLTWGSFTPLGHIWAAIPLFGRTRLQSRNLAIVDLALAVLFAFWVDGALAARSSVEGRERRLWSWARLRRWLPAVPAVGALVLGAVTLAAPGPVEEWFHATAAGAAHARGLWPWFLGQGVVAAAVVALVAGWRRLGEVARRRALVAVVVADIAFFVLATSTAVVPPPATHQPTRAAAAAVLGTNGRFAIVDTGVFHLDTLSTIGQPDLNAFTRLPSVTGYGSILSNTYGSKTGTHTLDTISACALEAGTFGPLRLSTLVAYAGDLAVGAPRVGPAPPPTRPPCPGARAPGPGTAHRRTLYLGWPVALRGATLVVTHPVAAAPKVGIVGPRGGTRWPDETVRPTSTGWSVVFSTPQTATGIVVEGPARVVADTSTVEGAQGGRWALDGLLQDALDTSAWRFVGTYDGAFGVFRRTAAPRPPVWLAGAVPGSSVRQLSAPDWGGATDRVVATRPVTVVWSEAYLPGWRATLTPVTPGGRPLTLVVRADGLIQSVRVPAGTWTLSFHYRPALLTLGIAGSAVAAAGFAVVGLLAITRRRRRVVRRRGERRIVATSQAPGLSRVAETRPDSVST
jgi:hypothetical protein